MAFGGQNPIQRWDSSQIENEEEEECWQDGVTREKERQEWREQRMPKVLPPYSGKKVTWKKHIRERW